MTIGTAIKIAVIQKNPGLAAYIADFLRFNKKLNYDQVFYTIVNSVEPISPAAWGILLNKANHYDH